MPTIDHVQGIVVNLDSDYHLLSWIEAFLIAKKSEGVSPGTLHFYRVKFALFTTYCNTQIITRIDQLTPEIIRRFLLRLGETGHNPGGVHACYRTLRTFLNWWEVETEPANWHNPIRKVQPPKLSGDPLDPVPIQSIDKMLDTCNSSTFYGDRDRAILMTLLDSGMRASELLDLQLSNLNMPTSSLIIQHGKGNKSRVTFVGKTTRRSIRNWIKSRGYEPGYLFTTKNGDQLTYWGLRMILRRRANNANISIPTPHDFRRAFCLSQLQAGVDIVTISRLMGHASTILIARYAKQSNRDLGDKYNSAVDRWHL
jgi:integrase/recombinase XerC